MNKKEFEIDYQRELLDLLYATKEMAEEDEKLKVFSPLLDGEIRQAERMITCIKEEGPLVCGTYCTFPEILKTMDIDWYNMVSAPLVGYTSLLDETGMQIFHDAIDRTTMPSYVCSFHKIVNERTFLSPTPSAVLGMSRPCDGVALLYSSMRQYWKREGWRNVANFDINTSYKDDEQGLKYTADEMRRVIAFLEEHTGKKLDMSKLKEVVDETNRHYELWGDCNDVSRSVPSPYAGFPGLFVWHAVTNSPMLIASAQTAEFIQQYTKLGMNKLKTEMDVLQKEEKIRMLWVDIPPFFGIEMVTLLMDEFGAKVVMDIHGFMRASSIVDTSSEQSMLEGLGIRHGFDSMMLRLSNGNIDRLLTDVEWIVKAYSIDCVVGAGHVGHKDCNSSKGLLTETCRHLGVPVLNFNWDSYDDRFTTLGEIETTFATFFEAYELGK